MVQLARCKHPNHLFVDMIQLVFSCELYVKDYSNLLSNQFVRVNLALDEDNKFFSLVRDGRARFPLPLRTTHDPDARASCLARSSTRILRRRPPLPLLRPPTRRRRRRARPRERTSVDAVRAPVCRALTGGGLRLTCMRAGL